VTVKNTPREPDPLIVELRALRIAQKMTLRMVAAALGLSTDSLRAWEAGRRRPSIDQVRQYANLVGRAL